MSDTDHNQGPQRGPELFQALWGDGASSRSPAYRVWWTRVCRAVQARPVGDKLLVDWCHGVLRISGGNKEEIVPGKRWQEIPPERLTIEYRREEIKRLNSELGVALGVGPMPDYTRSP